MKRLSLFTKCSILFVLLWLFLRFFIGGIISVPLPCKRDCDVSRADSAGNLGPRIC